MCDVSSCDIAYGSIDDNTIAIPSLEESMQELNKTFSYLISRAEYQHPSNLLGLKTSSGAISSISLSNLACY